MAQSEAFTRSEEKRLEALRATANARECQTNGDAAGAQQQVNNAWAAVGEALELCPANHRARFLLVSFAMNANDWERALTEAKHIYHDLTPQQLSQMKDSVLHLSISHACKILEKISEAIKITQEAAKLFPDDPQVFMSLAELRLLEGNAEESEKNCREALRLHDVPGCTHKLGRQNIVFTLCCLSNALHQQSRDKEAEKHLHAAYEIEPDSPLVLKNLLDLHESRGNTAAAIDYAQRLVRVDPEDNDTRLRLQHLQGGLGNLGDPEVDNFRLGASASSPRQITVGSTGSVISVNTTSTGSPGTRPTRPSINQSPRAVSSGYPDQLQVGKKAAPKNLSTRKKEEKSCDAWSLECCFGKGDDEEYDDDVKKK